MVLRSHMVFIIGYVFAWRNGRQQEFVCFLYIFKQLLVADRVSPAGSRGLDMYVSVSDIVRL